MVQIVKFIIWQIYGNTIFRSNWKCTTQKLPLHPGVESVIYECVHYNGSKNELNFTTQAVYTYSNIYMLQYSFCSSFWTRTHRTNTTVRCFSVCKTDAPSCNQIMQLCEKHFYVELKRVEWKLNQLISIRPYSIHSLRKHLTRYCQSNTQNRVNNHQKIIRHVSLKAATENVMLTAVHAESWPPRVQNIMHTDIIPITDDFWPAVGEGLIESCGRVPWRS